MGMIGIYAFLLALVALHFLDPGLSVVDSYISEYALGDYGWLSRAANFALGTGVLAIALGLRQTLASGRRATASWLLILIAGLGIIIAGIFVTDPPGAPETTTEGVVHVIAGYVSILGLVVAAWMLRGVIGRNHAFKDLASTQLWFAVLTTVALVAMFLLFEVSVGIPQRVFFVLISSWMWVLALTLRHT